MTPEQIVVLVQKWLQSASNPKSSDQQLVLKRIGFGKSAVTGAISEVRFSIEATEIICMVSLPVEEPLVVAPVGH